MLPDYLETPDFFSDFLTRVRTGVLPRAEWNHAAHLAASAACIASSPESEAMDRVRTMILTYNACQGIVSTPDYGYHETVTRFWVERIGALWAAMGRGATPYDLARAAVAAFAHRRGIFCHYYTFDVIASREARASFVAPDVLPSGHERNDGLGPAAHHR